MKPENSLPLRAGQNLRRLLAERNITQEKFALDYLKKDLRDFSRSLTRGICKLQTIEEYASLLEVDPLDLLK